MILTNWFSTLISFDGYLTESTSYQQFEVSAYLTGNPKQTQKRSKTIEQQAYSYLMVI